MDDLKYQVTSLNIYSYGEEIIRRTRQEIWDMISQIFNEEWEFMNLMTVEMEVYKSTMNEIKKVNGTLRENTT